MAISKMCQECTQRTKCPGKSEVAAGRLPCCHYELDPQLVSDQDIIPIIVPSLKDKPKLEVVKLLVPKIGLAVNAKKAANFERLALKRLKLVLDGMRKLGNLSNKSLYEWDSEQIETIICHIRNAADRFEKKFTK